MADWAVFFSPVAESDLSRFDAHLRKSINTKIAWLAENFDTIAPAPLHIPFDGLYKLRVGKIRVAYTIEAERRQLKIHHIEWRDRIYKRGR